LSAGEILQIGQKRASQGGSINGPGHF
jgi:hypothetical protein